MLDPWIGRRLGNYELEAVLGRGGMASVYRARHVALGTLHAVKILERVFAEHPAVKVRFLREGRVQAQFRHPGIARVTDTLDGDAVALVMELLEGESLREVLARGPVPPDAAAILVEDVADALAYAHARGVVHRDVKPDNVFLAEREEGMRAVLLDFGIARVEEMSSLTQTGILIGTPRYTAPEQLEDPRRVDGRADVFALGVLLYELLTGQTPHPGDTAREVTVSVLAGRSVPLRRRLPGAPMALEAAIERALCADPVGRTATVEAFAAAVREALGSWDDTPPSLPVTDREQALTWPPMPEERVADVLAARRAEGRTCPRCGVPNRLDQRRCLRCGQLFEA